MKTAVFARYSDGSMRRIDCYTFEAMLTAVKELSNCGMACIYVERLS